MELADRWAKYGQRQPLVSQAAFVAPDARIHGAVELRAETSVWYGAILRADLNTIVVGEGSNLQDGVIVHLADDYGVNVGANCSVGHRALLHACQIGKECLIGMGAIVMDGASIGEGSIIGAGALVLAGFECPPNSLVLGSPARVVRTVTGEQRAATVALAEKYRKLAYRHAG